MYKLHSLDAFVRVDAGRVVAGISVFLAEIRGLLVIVISGTVNIFLEDGFLVDSLELGLEVVQDLRAAVRSSSMIGKCVA